jgi:hypothetical protein
MTWILASFVVNVVVAGFMGAAIGFRLLPRMDRVFGADTAARQILACLYLAIAAASVVALFAPPLRLPIAAVLFPLQIFYKLLTLYFVRDRWNPVPWSNLVISVLLTVSLFFVWRL